jgi:hypothetical protein
MAVHFEQHSVKVKSIDDDPKTGRPRFTRGCQLPEEPITARGKRRVAKKSGGNHEVTSI